MKQVLESNRARPMEHRLADFLLRYRTTPHSTMGATTAELLKGLCHPTRMRKPMKTNLKKSARLFQVLSEILEGCFYLNLSHRSIVSEVLY